MSYLLLDELFFDHLIHKKVSTMKTLLTFLAILLFAPPASVGSAKEPYNILMIAVDDLNDWVGVYGGHPQAKTPNIDRLAQTSMVFRNASCPGPVCGPSRSALLSGFRPGTTGAYGNDTNMLKSKIVQTHATLPEYFSKHGYTTISSGKIFHKHETASGYHCGQRQTFGDGREVALHQP